VEFIGDTLDDVLLALYPAILKCGERVEGTRNPNLELTGATVEIRRPRARLSRTETRGNSFSCLGELLWYLSGSDSLEFIRRYIPMYANDSDDGVSIHGAYGPRLFNQRGINQIDNVVTLLKERPGSKRAVIQLFNAEDISKRYLEIPCTTALQFLVRKGKLDLVVTMRSNDAYKGLPHDVFCFTMLQEILARMLGIDVGIYKHFATSMHLYEEDVGMAEQYVGEAYQARIEMPEMPAGDPWPAIKVLLAAEGEIRSGARPDANAYALDSYWTDLIRLLQVFEASRDDEAIEALKSAMVFTRYGPYIDSRRARDLKARRKLKSNVAKS